MTDIFIKTVDGTCAITPLERRGDFAIHNVVTGAGVDVEQFCVTHVPSGYVIPLRIDGNGDWWLLTSLESAKAWLDLFLFKGGSDCIHQNESGNWSMDKRGQGILRMLAAQVTYIDERGDDE